MRALLFGVLAAVVTFLHAPAAQPTATGRLVVAGRVLTGTGPDARPVRRARVTLRSRSLETARLADTDTNGAYRFDRLPAGSYRLSVEKPGFVRLDADAEPDARLTLMRGGAIEGIVADANGDPVMNVTVSALRPVSSGGAPNVVTETRTDDLGRYRLHSLDAGGYVIQAATDGASIPIAPGQRPARSSRAYYPSSTSIDNAKAIHVELARDVTGVDVTFTPDVPTADSRPRPRPADGASGKARISGRVTDATSGKPIRNALMLLLSVDGISTQRSTATDARGRFDFTNLAARQYTLRATADRYVTLQYGRTRPDETGVFIDVAGGLDVTADMSLPRASAVEGELFDEFGDPAPGILVHVARKQYERGRQRLVVRGGMYPSTDDRGHYRIGGLDPGEYYVTALAGAFADSDAPGGFAPTHYPGTSDASGAMPLSVSPGADTLNASFTLVPAPAVTVSGVMVDADGQAVRGRGALVFATADHLRRADTQTAWDFTSEDGHFSFRGVPQGSYTLQGYGPPPADRQRPGGVNDLPWGWLGLTVGESDVDGLVLRVTEGRTLRGRITRDEENGPPLAPQQVRISPTPFEWDSAPFGGRPFPSETYDDWTFRVRQLSGRERVFVIVGSPAWMLKKITRDNIDVTDETLDFRDKDVAGLEVILTSKTTHVTGTVSDEHGSVKDYAVVIFSSDPTKWIDRSRFVVMARAGLQGRFDAGTLPPDDYLAVALPNVYGTEWMDPDFLRTLRPLASAFTLQEGESRALDLKLKTRP